MSNIFQGNNYDKVYNNLYSYCNIIKNEVILTDDTISSVRTAGDSIEHKICSNLPDALGKEFVDDFTLPSSRKSMEDVKFTVSGCEYTIDVKTHNIDTKFNMPNLTAVTNILKYFEDPSFNLMILLLSYKVDITNMNLHIENILFEPLEHLSWQCLTVGNLGWGQVQIANTKNIIVDKTVTRQEWLMDFCERTISFNQKLVESILTKRITKIEQFKDKIRNIGVVK